MNNILRSIMFLLSFSPIFLSIAITKYIDCPNEGIPTNYIVLFIVGVFFTFVIFNSIKKKAKK